MNDEPIRLRVRRVGAPRWAKWDSHTGPGMADMYAVTGEQPDWGWGIPLVHRAIASPSEGLPVPRKPAEGCNFSNALGYWAALLHVCLYTLGWVRPETGLFRLLESVDPEFGDVEDLDAGFDDAEVDPRVQLLRSVWLHDGDLALFVAWLSRFDLYQYRDLLERSRDNGSTSGHSRSTDSGLSTRQSGLPESGTRLQRQAAIHSTCRGIAAARLQIRHRTTGGRRTIASLFTTMARRR